MQTILSKKGNLKKRLSSVFKAEQASVLTDVITDAYDDLVKTSDFNELKGIVKELAEAQKRTENKVEELAEAQKRTEDEIRRLARHVGGVSDSVGFHLEDRAMKTLPVLLKRDFGVDVEGRLVRRFFVYGKRKSDEVNIYGKGRRGGKEIVILGEGKSQIGKGHIDDFLKVVKRVVVHTGDEDKERILLAVSYLIEPDVEEYAKNKGIKVYWSYEMDL